MDDIDLNLLFKTKTADGYFDGDIAFGQTLKMLLLQQGYLDTKLKKACLGLFRYPKINGLQSSRLYIPPDIRRTE